MLRFTSDEVLERVDEHGDLFAGTLDDDRSRPHHAEHGYWRVESERLRTFHPRSDR